MNCGRLSVFGTAALLATLWGCERTGKQPEPKDGIAESEASDPAGEQPTATQSGQSEQDDGAERSKDPTSPDNFKGKVSKSYEASKEWWPPRYKEAPKNAPNILVVLLDDTGFAQLGSFGGLINTPNLDKLAEGGLRFNNFHTTALCSPSRASIMAGRNPHSIGLGSHSLTAMGFPGYNAIIPEDAKSVAKVLEKNGYVNYFLGKWDHTPLYEVSQAGPFTRWPSGEGFQHFYGFMAADADQYRTAMYDGHTPIEPWVEKGAEYHLSTDLADKAIEYITGHKSTAPDRPFMVFMAPGAMHSPHQVPSEWIAKYKGKFDGGWDLAREEIIKGQIESGVVPEGTVLTQRIEEIPAWDSLRAEEKKLYARQMEVFAAMLEHTDAEIGRVIENLERIGELDNTLIILTSDNGASGEGGLAGTFNETYVLNGMQTEFSANMERFDAWGDRTTYPHYHAGWAMAGNTPFKYFKQSVHRGGIQDPLIMHWPNRIKARGEVRSQYHHISDIAPTILEAIGLELPKEIDGVRQRPMDGDSMMYTFDDPGADNAKKVQYYEMFGNRGLWADGWKAVSLHGNRMPWDVNSVAPFEDDTWELYHVAEDFSGAENLAERFPEKLDELKKQFDVEAKKYNVYPLYDDMIARISKQQDRIFEGRTEFVFYAPGATRIAEKASPPVKGRSHAIEGELKLKGGEQGVVVACGGFTGGYAVFIKGNRLYYDYNYLDGVHYVIKSPILKKGVVKYEIKFLHDGDFKGRGEMFIDGVKVGEVDMPKTHHSTFSLSEPFDVGVDNGTPVSTLYNDHFRYTGELDKVTFRLLDDPKASGATDKGKAAKDSMAPAADGTDGKKGAEAGGTEDAESGSLRNSPSE